MRQFWSVVGASWGVEPAAYEVPANWPVVDHGDATILPGLIEAQAHLVTDSGPMSLDRVAGYADDEIDTVVTTALQAQLASGVTTVRDLGDRGFNVVDRRDAQRAADDGLPRIVASGPPLTFPSGHCHYLRGEVQGADQIRAALADRVERGVDAVKIMASGGMNTPGTDPAAAAFAEEDLRLMVGLAHAAGLRVAVHAHAAAAIDLAVAIGVETLEHATYVTPGRHPVGDRHQRKPEPAGDLRAAGRAGRERGACLSHPGWLHPRALRGRTSSTQAAACRVGDYSGGGRRQSGCLSGACTKPAYASSADRTPASHPLKAHGRYPAAVVELAAVFGVVPSLVASTSTAAEVCGLGTATGSLRRGYDADLLVVDGDLATDLDLLWQVRQVVLRGRATPSPVQRDLEAGGT